MRSIRVDGDIRLRDPAASDAAELFSLVDANRRHLGRWLPWVPQIKTVEDELAWIAGRHAPGAADNELALLIVERASIIGGLGIAGLGSSSRAGEFGYWLVESAQGRGVVTRACSAALRYCFETRKMNRIQIRAAVDNIRSRAVPVRLGFSFEGIQRQAVLVDGHYQDLAVYSILAGEWRALRASPSTSPTASPRGARAPTSRRSPGPPARPSKRRGIRRRRASE